MAAPTTDATRSGATPTALTIDEARARARALRSELPPLAKEADQNNTDAAASMRKIWEAGLFAVHLPVEHGGTTDSDARQHTEPFFDLLLDLVAGDSAAGMNFVVQSLVTLELFEPGNGLPDSTKTELARLVHEEGTRFVASNSETGSKRPVTARRVEGGIVVDGIKTFNTNSGGGGIANVGIFSMDGVKESWHAVIPLAQANVHCRHDWDVMGQRGTHSQAIEYDEVFVPDGWYYEAHGFAAHMIPFVFMLHSAIMLGIGYGAYDAVISYVRTLDRPTLPEFGTASKDPLIRRRVGDFMSTLEAARAYLLQTARKIEAFDTSWETPAAAAVDGFSVKVACVRAGLHVSGEMFDLTGARGTSNRYGFDRFMRNARTFSTHDSTDAKEVWVGDWYLNGVEPPFVAMLRV